MNENNDKYSELVETIKHSEKTQLEINGRIHEDLKGIKDLMKKMVLGIYGDKENKIKGLVDHRIDMDEKYIRIEERVQKLENRSYKTSVWLIIGVAVIQIVLNYVLR